MASNTSVYGIFNDRYQAEAAVDRLRAAGFRREDISLLSQENAGTKDLKVEGNTKAPEGAAAGGAVGAVTGGVFGWLVGIGTIAIPGFGPFLAAGPIMSALAGLGAGATVGGLGGALVGAGIPEYEAKRFEGLVTKGGVLISVHCDDRDWTGRAKKLLKDGGAEEVSSSSEASAQYAVTDKPLPRRTAY
ncbi:MAG: DUF3341 domain-containing protein [Acidobacteria bacterium]|nr:DUF3341 domain-containing protein [Acidobacteriota bacterium]